MPRRAGAPSMSNWGSWRPTRCAIPAQIDGRRPARAPRALPYDIGSARSVPVHARGVDRDLRLRTMPELDHTKDSGPDAPHADAPHPGAAQHLTVRCQFCETWNRVDATRAAERPKCGKCAKPMLLDRPVPLSDDTFRRTIGASDIAA